MNNKKPQRNIPLKRDATGAQGQQRGNVPRSGNVPGSPRRAENPTTGQSKRSDSTEKMHTPVRNPALTNKKNKNQSTAPAQGTKPRRAVRSNQALSGSTKPAQIKPEHTKPAVKREDIIREDDIIRVKGTIDRPLFVIMLVLLCIGSVMVFSASYAYALSKTGDSYFFIKRQIVFVALGIVLTLIISRFDIRFIRKLTPLGFIITVGLLIIVLLYGIAAQSAQRWIEIPFFGTFQPSELMKLMLVLMLADIMDRNESKIMRYKYEKNGSPRHDRALFWHSTLYGVFIPLLIVIIVCGLVALEKHMSGTIILFIIGAVVIFAGGAMTRWLVGGAAVVSGGLGIVLMAVPYMKKRLDMFIHPELYDATNDTWQTTQGLIAVGSGGLLGVGLGQSRQKHMFVSQPQNDFIFSIICEELGFIGAVAILAIFAALIWRGLTIAMKAPDTFSRLSAIGITGHIAIQMVLNVMVVTNLIPNTGISLPFFSYGGSSLMCLMLEMGVLLCISKYSYQQK